MEETDGNYRLETAAACGHEAARAWEVWVLGFSRLPKWDEPGAEHWHKAAETCARLVASGMTAPELYEETVGRAGAGPAWLALGWADREGVRAAVAAMRASMAHTKFRIWIAEPLQSKLAAEVEAMVRALPNLAKMPGRQLRGVPATWVWDWPDGSRACRLKVSAESCDVSFYSKGRARWMPGCSETRYRGSAATAPLAVAMIEADGKLFDVMQAAAVVGVGSAVSGVPGGEPEIDAEFGDDDLGDGGPAPGWAEKLLNDLRELGLRSAEVEAPNGFRFGLSFAPPRPVTRRGSVRR